MTRHKTPQQVTFDVGARRLSDPKLKQEKLQMEQRDVIFEYGKLQLNFVASQQQVAQLATLLASANKEIAELKKKLDTGADKPTPELVPDRAESAGA